MNSALRHGQHVLGEAEDLAQQDPSNPSGRTIEQPGPGLFDSPLSISTFRHRWHDLRPVYGQIFRGWIATYDNLVRNVSPDDYQMDYPPLRSLVMTLWAWKVKAEYPSINQFPQGPVPLVNPFTQLRQTATPEIVHPLLMCNMVFEAISSIAIFFLVLIWVRRDDRNVAALSWRGRWGDPMLLAAPILLGIFTLLAPYIRFDSALFNVSSSPIDNRVTSIGWWIFLVLRFTSAVALARFLPPPFRRRLRSGRRDVGVDQPCFHSRQLWLAAMGSVAAAIPPGRRRAGLARLVAHRRPGAGRRLHVQRPTSFPLPRPRARSAVCGLADPVPSHRHRPHRRGRTGRLALAGQHIPHQVLHLCALFAAALACVLTFFRRPLRHELARFTSRFFPRFDPPRPAPKIPWHTWTAISLCFLTAAFLPLLIYRRQDPSLHIWTILLTLAILVIPWFLRRRTFAAWLVLVFSASLWLAAFSLNGSFSWWQVGFLYGTQKHQDMQLGAQSLSNLSSILSQRYGWNLHDDVGNIHIPFVAAPIDMDLQTALATVFAITLLFCTFAAAVHLRRRDKKFLVALVAPCILFVTLLTQMAARYTMFSAVIASLLVAVSVGMSLLELLLVILSSAMLGNQLLASFPDTAPVTFSITRPTYPDAGWMMLLLAALILVSAMIPSVRKPKPETIVVLTPLNSA